MWGGERAEFLVTQQVRGTPGVFCILCLDSPRTLVIVPPALSCFTR